MKHQDPTTENTNIQTKVTQTDILKDQSKEKSGSQNIEAKPVKKKKLKGTSKAPNTDKPTQEEGKKDKADDIRKDEMVKEVIEETKIANIGVEKNQQEEMSEKQTESLSKTQDQGSNITIAKMEVKESPSNNENRYSYEIHKGPAQEKDESLAVKNKVESQDVNKAVVVDSLSHQGQGGQETKGESKNKIKDSNLKPADETKKTGDTSLSKDEKEDSSLNTSGVKAITARQENEQKAERLELIEEISQYEPAVEPAMEQKEEKVVDEDNLPLLEKVEQPTVDKTEKGQEQQENLDEAVIEEENSQLAEKASLRLNRMKTNEKDENLQAQQDEVTMSEKATNDVAEVMAVTENVIDKKEDEAQLEKLHSAKQKETKKKKSPKTGKALKENISDQDTLTQSKTNDTLENVEPLKSKDVSPVINEPEKESLQETANTYLTTEVKYP